MKILVIGVGGREHALVWKLRESPGVEKIWCAPGNAGIAGEAECIAVDPGDVNALVALAEKLRPDLTVVGPELPLVNGIGDAFRARKLAIVAPSQIAAQLEGSKIFSKQFLLRHKIPTAKMYGAFDSASGAYDALADAAWPLVIKADGLCAGKGVLVTSDEKEARAFIASAMEMGELGPGGRKILLEEGLSGEELSFILLTDGEHHASLVPTRDHKRIFDGNRGPNTGGMGAYSTDTLLSPELRERIGKQIVEPTLHGLSADGIRYSGFLYVGLMLAADGPKVLEFNCRLGDPETQAILARVDFDLAQVLADVAGRRFDPSVLKWKAGASACVVIASAGYPGRADSGKLIEGLTDAEQVTGVKVLHAGTKRVPGGIATAGGRVLGVTAAGPTLEEALATAYRGVEQIRFEGMQYRRDIGGATSRARSAGE